MEPGEPFDLRIAGLGPAEVIGEGGNAVVYRSRQDSLDRDVAVKILKRASDEGTKRRFGREQRAMGRMSQHDGMVTVYESGINGAGEPYLVMPLLPGSLQDDIDSRGRLPWSEAVDVIASVATTVHFAHLDGVVHRDLKPANLMRSTTGRPLVADFGISRIVDAKVSIESTGLTLTPGFSPPEALEGDDAGPTTDVYALGATLYALIEGHPPFVDSVTSGNLLALVRRISEDPVPPLTVEVPGWIDVVIAAAMAKDPTERIASAEELARLLRSGGAGLVDGSARPVDRSGRQGAPSTIISGGQALDSGVGPSTAPPMESTRSRRTWLKLGAAAGGIAVVAAGAIAATAGDGAEDAEPVLDSTGLVAADPPSPDAADPPSSVAADPPSSVAVSAADGTLPVDTGTALGDIVTTVPRTTFETVVLQAEDQVLTPPMAARTDLTAEGSAYVSTEVANEGVVRFDFDVAQEERYFVWARVSSPEPWLNNNSFAVRLDDGEVDVWDFFESAEDDDVLVGWKWDLISTRCGGSFDTHLCDPFRPNLESTRSHTLALSGRESFSAVDVIVVTNDPDYDPALTRSS